MSKARANDQPSVEELLASIREAIYADGEGQGGTGMLAAGRKAPQARKEAGQARKEAGQGAAPGKVAAAPASGQSHSSAERIYNGAEPAALVPHGTMRGMRVSLDHGEGGAGRVSTRTDDFLNLRQRLTTLAEEGRSAGAKRTMVTSSPEGFTGILGGDVRLEEALARLSRAGRQPRSEEIARPLVPPSPSSPAPPRSRPLDSAAVEQLAGRELKPAIREAIDAELQALPRETGRAPAAAAVPQPEPPDYAEPAYAEPPYAEPAYAETPADAAGQQGYDAPPADAWAEPGAETGDAAWAYPPEGPPPGYGGWQAGPYPPTHEQHGYEQHQGYAPPEGHWQHQGYPPPMLAPDSADQAGSAFNRLADTIMAQATGGERSIEDLTRELLRPMLKSWLDYNLPHLVERLVREEIERVARRGSR